MDYFIIEKNELNNNYMVHSKCEQLPQCYAFKSKKEAKELAKILNIQANLDAKDFKGLITFKK